MSKRWRRGMAEHDRAMKSWSIKFARVDDQGNLKRYRSHFPAALGYRASAAEHRECRQRAHDAAKAKAKALTEDPTVVWVTVYPPFKRNLFNLKYGHPEWEDRIAPIAKWTRRKGWTLETDSKE